MNDRYECARELIMEIKPDNSMYMDMPLKEMNREELLRVACGAFSEIGSMRKKLENAYNL